MYVRTPETWGQRAPDLGGPAVEPVPLAEPEGGQQRPPSAWRQIPGWRHRRRNGRRGGPPPPPPAHDPPPATMPPPPPPPAPPVDVPHLSAPQMQSQGPRVLRRQFHVPHLTAGPDPPPQRAESWSIWQRTFPVP